MKKLLTTLGFILILSIGFVAHSWFFRPVFINHFFEISFLKFTVKNPEILTQTRLLKPLGLDFYHDDLSDQSDANAEAFAEDLQKAHETLLSYNDASLSPEQLTSKRVFLAFLEPQIELRPYIHYDYPFNQLFGYQNTWPSFMTDAHWVEDKGDAEAYLSRLHKLKTAFKQRQDGMLNRAEAGITPPTFVIDKVIENIDNFISVPPSENALVTSFVNKISASGMAPADWEQKVTQAVETDVYGAFNNLREFLINFRAKTNTNDGVWKHPDGDKFYDLKLWEMTTLRISANKIHQRGLTEVKRIQKEILTILKNEGYPTEEGFATAIKALTDDPQYYYKEDERAQVLEDYETIIAEIEPHLESWFRLRHRAPVEVHRVPEFREKTAPGAYYHPPSMDGEVPGRFYANLYDLKATPKWSMRTLAYHEAVPGHHLQLAIATELKRLPTFRRILPFTSYAEGWALYAEHLAWEMGLQAKPLDNVGRLQAELFRAVRLVVDTGIHRYKWTREKAIEYMSTNLGTAESDVIAEVERYIVMPGQATAYKVGMDFLLDQRKKAQEALGEAFDYRDFHDTILQNSSMPLSLVEEEIDAYIKRKADSNPTNGS